MNKPTMYKVTVTTGGTTATASKLCRTQREAESVKTKLLKILRMPVEVEITPIGTPKKY